MMKALNKLRYFAGYIDGEQNVCVMVRKSKVTIID